MRDCGERSYRTPSTSPNIFFYLTQSRKDAKEEVSDRTPSTPKQRSHPSTSQTAIPFLRNATRTVSFAIAPPHPPNNELTKALWASKKQRLRYRTPSTPQVAIPMERFAIA
ncbi:hypothetical protein ACSQ6I_10030 [Anabaena sp. WFMT]|uniref:hypothetical protein n=1 Tax=Anabaena sp. WFMT TaxID=3449730 RepID=UPI003F242726